MPEHLKQNPETSMSAKRLIKLAEILDAAASHMNEWGATTVSLNEVAKAVGLSRNSLYYYFKDRLALVVACYLRSGEVQGADLADACKLASSAADQLEIFVNRQLDANRQEQAILCDLDSLPDSYRTQIQAINQQNTTALALIIQRGINSQEFRVVNVDIAVQVLLGMLSWTQLWQKWHGFDRSAAEAMIDVFLNGMSANRSYHFECAVHVQTLRARHVNLFDSANVSAEKRLQLIGVASLLFNQKGIESTSLDDLADYIGATKGSIYHYFKDKPSLVRECYENAFEQYELFAKISFGGASDGLNKILTALHLNCQAQASNNPPLILQSGLSAYSSDYNLQALALVEQYENIRLEAIRDGSVRDVGKGSVELSAGSFFWIQAWLIQNPETNGLLLADSICHVISGGLKR